MFLIHLLSFSYCSTILNRHSPAMESSLIMICGAKGYIDLPWTFEYESARLFLDNMFNSLLGQICTLHPVILCFHITIFASSSHISMSYLYKLQIYVLISCSTYLQQPPCHCFVFLINNHTMFYLGCLQTHS